LEKLDGDLREILFREPAIQIIEVTDRVV